MAGRGWFLDIVQDVINYEMRIQQLTENLARAAEANKLMTVRIKELEAKVREE